MKGLRCLGINVPGEAEMKGYPYVEYQKSEVRYFHGIPFGITRSSVHPSAGLCFSDSHTALVDQGLIEDAAHSLESPRHIECIGQARGIAHVRLSG